MAKIQLNLTKGTQYIPCNHQHDMTSFINVMRYYWM